MKEGGKPVRRFFKIGDDRSGNTTKVEELLVVAGDFVRDTYEE